jgi:hypothetical protein
MISGSFQIYNFQGIWFIATTLVVSCLLIFDGVLSCVVVVLFMVLRFVDPSFWICNWLWARLCIKTLSLSWFLVMVLFGSKAPILFVMIRSRGLLERKSDYVSGRLIHLFEMWRFTQHIFLLSGFAPVCDSLGNAWCICICFNLFQTIFIVFGLFVYSFGLMIWFDWIWFKSTDILYSLLFSF